MTENQKQAAAYLGVGLLVIAVIAMIWLAVQAGNSDILDKSDPDNEKLNHTWRAVAWFMKAGVGLNTLFATLLTVISTTVTIVGETYKKTFEILVICVLCLIGIVAVIFVLTQFTATNDLRYYGEFKGVDNAGVKKLLLSFLGPVIGWFSLFLATQLGVSVVNKEGSVRKLTGL